MLDKNFSSSVTRRDLLKTGAVTAAMLAGSPVMSAAESATTAPASQASLSLPTRPLGKTGVKVTVVSLGSGKPPTSRMLERAYGLGVRYFDTAASYGKGESEKEIGKWFRNTGKRREIFLVTKQEGAPSELLANLDARLEALQTDYIDLFFCHAVQKPDLILSGQLQEVGAKLKKNGKVKFVGFSSHAAQAPQCLEAAAKSGGIDAIMVAYNPIAGDQKDAALDKALTACHTAGIGLIAMKTTRGLKATVDSDKIGDLDVHQAIIKTVLSDMRIAAVCSSMENYVQLERNTAVARTLDRPLTSAQQEQLRKIMLRSDLTWCPGCQSCRQGLAAVHPHAHDVARYLSYFEQDGQHNLAREFYRALPAGALAVPADALAAARDACAFHVDYPSLFARAAEKLA